jgi:hypothetical protein
MRPFAAVHSNVFLTAVHPWPLQEFRPLHDDPSCVDLQALWPLQALVPAHLMAPCAWAAAIEPAANNAAAVAITIFVFINPLPFVARIGELPTGGKSIARSAEADNGFAMKIAGAAGLPQRSHQR